MLVDMSSARVRAILDADDEAPGLTYWECTECADYCWLAAKEERPECSCAEAFDRSMSVDRKDQP